MTTKKPCYEERVKQALTKAKEYLLKTRDEDGLWGSPNLFTLPSQYQNPLVKSCHAIRALLTLSPFLEQEESIKLRESLFTLIHYPIPTDAPVEHFAFKLLTTAFSNTEQTRRVREETLQAIMQASKGGFWESYSPTHHFTNYLILDAFQQNGIAPPKSFPQWAWKLLNKKGTGWGLSAEGEAETSTTATITLCCLFTGVPAKEERLQPILKALVAKQRADGGWTATAQTDNKHSCYHSTALVLLCLLLTGHDDEERVGKAVDFLLDGQQDDGSWGFSTESATPQLFTTYYVTNTLAFMAALHQELTPQYQFLKENLAREEYRLYRYSEFLHKVRSRFLTAPTNALYETRAIGATSEAQERRRDILTVLGAHGPLDNAEVIEALQAAYRSRYGHLRKKHHLTLIKNDLSYLRSLRLVLKVGWKHCMIIAPPEHANE